VLKILLIGSTAVGKSALLLKYCDNTIRNRQLKSRRDSADLNSDNNNINQLSTTIGIDLKIKLCNVDNKLFKIIMWDTAGQERYRTIIPSLYKHSNGILLIYDITNKKSFLDLKNLWINECINYNNNHNDTIYFIVGNKRDSVRNEESKRQVSYDDLKVFAN
ncbi:Rab family GTPase, partial [Ascoidea rubescens DSM 1968]